MCKTLTMIYDGLWLDIAAVSIWMAVNEQRHGGNVRHNIGRAAWN